MPVEVKMPQLGESVTEGTVGKWLKEAGEEVTKYEPLLEVVTDKVDTEITATHSGKLVDILVDEGETVKVGTVLAHLETDEEAVEAPPGEIPEPERVRPEVEEKPQRPERQPGRPRISPVVSRIAAEHNVDVEKVEGSGRGGRVTKKDILSYIEDREEAKEVPVTEAAPGVPKEVAKSIELTPMRRSIAEHMVRSKRTAAHVTSVMEADMSNVVEAREAHKKRFEEREGVRLTYTPFFVQAVVAALKEHPVLNSTFTDDEILLHKPINIGMAVAIETGLIVPVIKNADEKSLLKLAKDVNDLAQRARNKQLSPDDVQEGTFTITNHGVGGSLFATPIINQPQAAILGVGAIKKRPVVIDDAIAIRAMAYLSVTFDHRITDGATADAFLADLIEHLESSDFSL